jgi:hypothetical protein
VAFHLHKTRNFFERLEGKTEAAIGAAEKMEEMREKLDGLTLEEALIAAEREDNDKKSPLMKGMLKKKAKVDF